MELYPVALALLMIGGAVGYYKGRLDEMEKHRPLSADDEASMKVAEKKYLDPRTGAVLTDREAGGDG